MPFDELLYARVDLIHDDDGAPRVLELELTEPSLFFGHAPGSADRFARVIVERARGG
jgi:O-ureido-D-serine cyclo-ligase